MTQNDKQALLGVLIIFNTCLSIISIGVTIGNLARGGYDKSLTEGGLDAFDIADISMNYLSIAFDIATTLASISINKKGCCQKVTPICFSVGGFIASTIGFFDKGATKAVASGLSIGSVIASNAAAHIDCCDEDNDQSCGCST